MVFALLIDWISSYYHQEIWRGVQGYCRDHGVNLLTLVTGRPGSPFRWEHMRHQLLEFVDGQRFDGFLFLGATLGNHLDDEQFHQLLTQVRPTPVVSLGAEIEDTPALVIDNPRGFVQLLEHLHGVHGVRRFAWIGGPEANVDHRQRWSVIHQFVEERGLVLLPQHHVTRDFTSQWGQDAVDLLIPGDRPDFEALVCANDDIAMGALEALARKGIQVPEDLLVTGFDDALIADQAGLTTVRQPLVDLGRRGAAHLLAEVRGLAAPRKWTLDTELVVRQSCGCESLAVQAYEVVPGTELAGPFAQIARFRWPALVDELARGLPRDAAEDLARSFLGAWDTRTPREFIRSLRSMLHRLALVRTPPGALNHPLSVLRRWVFQCSEAPEALAYAEALIHRARILLSEALHTQDVQSTLRQQRIQDRLSALNERLLASKTFADQAQIFLEVFPSLGVDHFRLALYEDPSHPMHRARLVLTERGEVSEDVVYDPKTVFPTGYAPPTEPWSYVAEALFDQRAPLGFFLLDACGNTELLGVFDQLCERVARGVETLRRIQELEEQVALRTEELRDALDDLEASNAQLRELALRDELTGLYNRRGFLSLAEHQLKTRSRRHTSLVLFFGDLDGLKAINDNRGHEAGDEALRVSGQLLSETFRADDVVARLGGDEFVVLAIGCDAGAAQGLARRLDEAFARTEGPLGMSLGWIVLDPRVPRSLADWMREADEALYLQKTARKRDQGSQAR